MSRLLRSVRFGIVTLAAVTALAGCVTLPGSSDVNQGRREGSHTKPQPIRYTPQPPRRGMSKHDVATGYLLAMLGAPPVPETVREYLTPDQQNWQPGSLLRVYQNSSVESGPKGSIHFSATELGSVDNRGSWATASVGDDTLGRNLRFQRVNGQWRIANPFVGTLVDADAFERYYREYSLYFFDGTHTVLVPDPVYQYTGVLSQSQIATRLVANLLEGPTAAMNGVVSGVVPRATRLAPGVSVSPVGLATVRLSSEAATMSGTSLYSFAAQLSWTLRQGGLGINRIQITVGGKVLRVPAVGDSFPAPNAFTTLDPTGINPANALYAIRNHRLVSVGYNSPDGGSFRPTGLIRDVHDGRSVAVSLDGKTAAMVSQDGSTVYVADITSNDDQSSRVPTWLTKTDNALKPSWDFNGVLWVVDQSDTAARLTVALGPEDKDKRTIDAPGITGEQVDAIAVSHDGARLAAIVGSGKDSRLVIGMIKRDPSHPLKIKVTGARTIANAALPLRGLTSLAWYSPTVISVLAQAPGGGETQPYQVTIDGSRVQQMNSFLPVLPDSLTASGKPLPQPVIGSNGSLYRQIPNQQWAPIPTIEGIRLLAPTFPG